MVGSPQPLREDLATAIAGMLAGISLTGLTVQRNRTRPVKDTDCPLLLLHEGEESEPVEDAGGDILIATFVIEGWVKGNTDAVLGPAANELYAETIKALKGGDYPTGTLRGSRGGCVWGVDEEDGHKPTMSFELEWRVLYRVDPNNPYLSA